MPEETTMPVQSDVPVTQDLSEQLRQQIWGDSPTQATQENVEQPSAQPATETTQPTTPAEDEEEVIEPSVWLKEKWGWDNEETADKEIKELRELKNKQPEEIKFANDFSKQAFDYLREGKEDELFSHLSTKKTLDKLLSKDIDEKSAADIIKFSLKSKYKDFNDNDVENKFNRQYGIPKEPIQKDTETQEEFDERHNEWKEKVQQVKEDLILDAKIAKPELEKLKSELVLPDINSNKSNPQQPSAEQLAAFEKQKSSFLESVPNLLNEVKGFSANVKNKDVDYTVSYDLSQEEKDAVNSSMKLFAENLDANDLFAQRWVNDDGSINAKQVIKDLVNLNKDDEKALSKIANEAANQRLELFLKSKKKINVDETNVNRTTMPEDKTVSERLAESFFGS